MKIEKSVERISWHHYTGIFLLSLATLLLELALTRVLSVALWYHFGFLIISTALLGFGASGVVLGVWQTLRERIALDWALTALALAFGALTIICFWLMQRIPFDPFSLLSDRRQIYYMPLYYLIISVPFFCSGLALALLFTRGVRHIHRLYACDLFGAGLGCAAIALVMPIFGGSGSVVVAAALGLLAAAVFAVRIVRRLAGVCLGLCVGAFVLAALADRALPISVTPNKQQPPPPPLYTAWNTFSRIDVYQVTQAQLIVFDAGTALTRMPDLRPGVRKFLSRNTQDAAYESGIAYVGKDHPNILIIGSGGGSQVLDALHFGASKVTAVEINPIINDLVRNQMNNYLGGLFSQPEVQLVTEEGRNYVQRSSEQYDAIISVHTISNAAITSGALALAENYVLTREAFEVYLDHLTPDGMIYMTRPESQMPRLFATAREALAARGVSDLAAHFYAFRLPVGPPTRPSFSAGFLLKKSAFTPDELRRIEELLGVGRASTGPNQPAPEVLYSPLAPHAGSLYDTLVTAPDLSAVYSTQTTLLEPATDDRPFFNQHMRWSNLTLDTLRDLFTQQGLGRLALEDRPIVEVTLLVLLAQTILIAGVFILLPLARFSRVGLRALQRWRFLLYFAGLGLGFILTETALLGRFLLFLGQPVYTFAVVLASLLIFTGVGAYLAERFRLPPRQTLQRIVPLIVLTLIAMTFALPALFSFVLGLALEWRVTLAGVVIAPLGILLGMPFPMGLRIVSEEASALVPWSWGVNGFFTVIGAVTAQVLSISFGFKTVLLVGAVCYLMALAALAVRNNKFTPMAS